MPDNVLCRGLVVRHHVDLEECVHHVLGVQLPQHPDNAQDYEMYIVKQDKLLKNSDRDSDRCRQAWRHIEEPMVFIIDGCFFTVRME